MSQLIYLFMKMHYYDSDDDCVHYKHLMSVQEDPCQNHKFPAYLGYASYGNMPCNKESI